MAKYISGKVKDLNVGISNYSENKTSVTVIGNVGIGTLVPTDEVGSGNTAVLAAGIVSAYQLYGDGSALTGISATDRVVTDSLDVLGISTLRGTLSVAGVTTLSGNIFLGDGADNINVNGNFISGLNPFGYGQYDLGTPGQYWRNLYLSDNVEANVGILTHANISGVTTVGSLVGISGSLTNINVTGVGTFAELYVSGVSTFAGDINANGNIVGDNSTDITGISSVFATKFYGDGSNLTNLPGIDTTGGSVFTDLYVSGLSTFVGQIDADAGLTVAGITTLSNSLDITGSNDLTFGNGNNTLFKSGDDIKWNISGDSNLELRVNASGGHAGNIIFYSSSEILRVGSGGVLASGMLTATTFSGNITGTAATFTGDVSIGGTLTYEDVTNIDSIGIITAREGIRIGAGKSIGSDGAAAVYYGDGSNLTGVHTTGSVGGWNPDSQENLYAGTDAGKCSSSASCYNVAIGYRAGCKIGTSGILADDNVFIGKYAGRYNDTGLYNTFLGSQAGCNNSGGTLNTAVGYRALQQIGTGNANTAVGDGAGRSTSGYCNTFLGVEAGGNNTSGCCNIAIGRAVCLPSATTNNQFAIGSGTCHWITGDSSFNIGIGTNRHDTVIGSGVTAKLSVGIVSAHQLHTDGLVVTGVSTISDTVTISAAINALSVNSTTSNQALNIQLNGSTKGKFTPESDGVAWETSGGNHVILKPNASGGTSGDVIFTSGSTPLARVKGTGDVGIGTEVPTDPATSANTSVTSVGILTAYQLYGDGSGLTGLTTSGGSPTAWIPDADLNLKAGTCAGEDLDGTSGCCNILIGECAGREMTSGSVNIAIGKLALGNGVVTGTVNTVVGRCAGYDLTSGCYNAIFGESAGRKVTYGCNNTLIGAFAGWNISTGDRNIALGRETLGGFGGHSTDATGSDNIGLGYRVGWKLTSGSNNIILGCNAGIGQTNANDNILLGQCAGYNVNAYPNATCGAEGYGCRNVIIGSNAGIGYTSHDRIVAIGYQAGKAAITDSCYGENGSVNIGYKAGCGYKGCSGISIGDCANGTGTADGDGGFGIAIGKEAKAGSQSIAIGCNAGNSPHGNDSRGILIGKATGQALNSAWDNIFIGTYAGRCVGYESACNLYLGQYAGQYMTKGCASVIIGAGVTQAPVNDGSNLSDGCQLVIGVGTTSWIIGNKDFNVGIGTTNPDAPVTSGNTQKLSVGILSAYQLYGDGQYLTGVASTDSWAPDSQENLVAGNGAGAARDADTCCNIMIGCNAGASLNSGDDNVFIGNYAACEMGGGTYNLILGHRAGRCMSNATSNVILGHNAATCASGTLEYNVVIGYNAMIKNTAAREHNIVIGREAGCCLGNGWHNVLIGTCAGKDLGLACCNIIIGRHVQAPNSDDKLQLAIGDGSNRWITGTCDFDVTLAGIATVYSSTGIVSATSYYGDGSNLTNVGAASTDSWLQDSQGNLVAGTGAGAARDTDTCFNIMIGCNAGVLLNEGDDNILIGEKSGQCMTSGSMNLFMGRYSGRCNTSGTHNIGLGYGVMSWTTITGSCNIGFGYNALANITSGACNIAIGRCAGINLSDGACNIIIGTEAGKTMTSGAENHIIIGYEAGLCLPGTTNNNIFIGCEAGRCSENCWNVAIGMKAGYKLSSGKYNSFYGICAGAGEGDANSGSYNVFFGYKAGENNITGDANVSIGPYAGPRHGGVGRGCGDCNTFVGACAGGYITTGDHNAFFGADAGRNITIGGCNLLAGSRAGYDITEGCDNVVLGHRAGNNMTTACYNVIIGSCAAQNCTFTGITNVAIGYQAGFCLTSGSNNVLLGNYAGHDITSVNANVMIGNYAGQCHLSGAENVFISHCAGRCMCNGSDNVAIGHHALQGSSTVSDNTGQRNVVIGNKAGCVVTSGCSNILIGDCAGDNVTSGSNNVIIGTGVDVGSAHLDDQLRIGSGGSYWIEGDSGFNTFFNSANFNGTVCATNFNSTSDIRLKTNIQLIGDPIGKVKQIEGVSFNWKKDDKPALGVIADQVEKILPELVDGDDPKTVNYNGLIGLLIETVKEQQNQIDELNDRISKLE